MYSNSQIMDYQYNGIPFKTFKCKIYFVLKFDAIRKKLFWSHKLISIKFYFLFLLVFY